MTDFVHLLALYLVTAIPLAILLGKWMRCCGAADKADVE